MHRDNRTLPGHCPQCGHWARTGAPHEQLLSGLMCQCPPANGRTEALPVEKPAAKRGRSKRGGQDA